MAEAVARSGSNSGYSRIGVAPIAGALGAEIEGVDIAAGLDEETFDEIHRAWLEHSVIYFRGQDMTPEDHIAFARRFGDIHRHLFNKAMDNHPEITELLKRPDQKLNSGGRWHSDQMYTAQPAKATILLAREMPAYGGDTMFSSMYKAYDALSDGLKKTLAGMRGISNGDNRNNPSGMTRKERVAAGIAQIAQIDPGDEQTISSHPVIRTHPETARRCMWAGIQSDSTAGRKKRANRCWTTCWPMRPGRNSSAASAGPSAR
jgi:taurine dioxygenase